MSGMGKHLFFIILHLTSLLRSLLAPLICPFLILLTSRGRNRIFFELKNLKDEASRSFRRENIKALATFEISSEGELEQVKPLLEHYLDEKKYVELVYSSDSVEAKVQRLTQKYPVHLRVYRLPLFTHFFLPVFLFQSLKHWVTSDLIILCRYDFFPELLLLSKGRKMVLVSATLKNKEDIFESYVSLKKYYYSQIMSLFHLFVAATAKDQSLLKRYFPAAKITFFDFRILQIQKRRDDVFKTLDQHIFYGALKRLFSRYDIRTSVIFGSVWPHEMEIFADPAFIDAILDQKIFVFLAPHKIKEADVHELADELRRVSKNQIPLYFFEKGMEEAAYREVVKEFEERPGVVISSIPGVLCELYSLFGHAFVGGGHGRSIHSVLEPYVCGTNVFCGPKTHRSTEFDFILENSPSFLTVVDDLKDFYRFYLTKRANLIDYDVRTEIVEKHQKLFLHLPELIVGLLDDHKKY